MKGLVFLDRLWVCSSDFRDKINQSFCIFLYGPKGVLINICAKYNDSTSNKCPLIAEITNLIQACLYTADFKAKAIGIFHWNRVVFSSHEEKQN